jgi:hypothetical protein
MKAYQQGDVILHKVDNIPENAVKKQPTSRGYVLAEGEATGHAHTLSVDTCEMFEYVGITYVSVEEATPLKHEEHKEQQILPGVYKVGIVTEVDPFSGEIHQVKD